MKKSVHILLIKKVLLTLCHCYIVSISLKQTCRCDYKSSYFSQFSKLQLNEPNGLTPRLLLWLLRLTDKWVSTMNWVKSVEHCTANSCFLISSRPMTIFWLISYFATAVFSMKYYFSDCGLMENGNSSWTNDNMYCYLIKFDLNASLCKVLYILFVFTEGRTKEPINVAKLLLAKTT